MKLGSLKSISSRDGELCLVNRTLTTAVRATHIIPTFQQAVENWHDIEPELKALHHALHQQTAKSTFAFNPNEMAAPLPRAYQWADGSAYVKHVELVRKARGAVMPENFWTDPLMYQGGSDTFLGPMDPISGLDESFGIDFEAEVAIITDDVPMGVSATDAEKHILFLMLANDVSLRHLISDELAKGFGFFHSKPSSSFSPLALTPDELAPYWDNKRLHRPLKSYLNDALFGEPDAGIDMTFSFPELIAHAAKTRRLGAGTIIGSGTVSNTDARKGSSCIVEKRMLEILECGQAKTPFMHLGDTIRILMEDDQGQNLFGTIYQEVTR
jgi:fumarylacetoacetate (FAA) hydrolase